MARQASFQCPNCGRRKLHERREFSTGAGCVLTVLTAGIFLAFWAFLALADLTNPWVCQTCGGARPIGAGLRIVVTVAVVLVLGVAAVAATFAFPVLRRLVADNRATEGASAPAVPTRRDQLDRDTERELVAALRHVDPTGELVVPESVVVERGKARITAGVGWRVRPREDRIAMVDQITKAWGRVSGLAKPRWVLVDAAGTLLGGWSEWKGEGYVVED